MTRLAPAIAAHGLPTGHSLPSGILDDDGFASLLADSERHGIVGLLGFAVGSGALTVSDAQRAAVEDLVAGWSAHAVRIERLLLRALDVLAAERIRARVLEGVTLAHSAYRQPELRSFEDVELLVPHDDAASAVAALDAPDLDVRFGEGVVLRAEPRSEDLFAPPIRFPLAGYELEALPMPQRLVQACRAAAPDDRSPRLMSLRDVAELVLGERPNLVDVLLAARAWGCEVVVARAVATAWDALAVTETPSIVTWSRRHVPGRTDHVLPASHDGPARAFPRPRAAAVVPPMVADRPGDVGRGTTRGHDDAPRLRRAPHVLWRSTLDTVVLLPVSRVVDEPFALAGVGCELWGLLAHPRSLDDVVEQLVARRDVEPEVVAADVQCVVAQLLDLGALEAV